MRKTTRVSKDCHKAHGEYTGTFNWIEQGAVRKLEKDTTELNIVPKSLRKDFENRKVISNVNSNVNSIVNFPSGIKSQSGIFVHGIGGKECFPKANIREIHKIFLDKGFFA